MHSDAETFDPSPGVFPPPSLLEGTVGWPGSPEVVELGTESGDGMSMVRVTLFDGAPQGTPKSDDGLANGRQISARPMGPGWRTPKRGERVLVAFPGNDHATPGNAVILGIIGASPSARFGRKKTVLDFGDDDVVITGKSVSLVVEDPDGPHRFVVSVSRKGGAQVIADGSGLFAKDGEVNVKAVDNSGNLKTALVLAQDEVSLSENATGKASSLTLSGGNMTLVGTFVSVAFSTALGLGRNASPATPVTLGPVGSTAAGSLCIWGAMSP